MVGDNTHTSTHIPFPFTNMEVKYMRTEQKARYNSEKLNF